MNAGIKLLCSSLLLFIVSISASAQRSKETPEGLALHCLVAQPVQPVSRPPLVILLHGYGSNEADLFTLKDIFPPGFLVVAARAPLQISGAAYQWYHMLQRNGQRDGDTADIRKSLGRIKLLVNQLLHRYHADPSRVYLVGFSQGGIICLEAGLTEPGLFKGIAVLSGRLLPSLKAQVQADKRLPELRVFIGHGTADAVLPYQDAVATNDYLKQLGLKPVFRTYTGMAHQISAAESKELKEWIDQ